MVFHGPQETLNDRQTVGQIVREQLEAHDWPTLTVAVTGVDEASVVGDSPVEDRTDGESVDDAESADVTVDLGESDHEVAVRERLPLDSSDVSVSIDRVRADDRSASIEPS